MKSVRRHSECRSADIEHRRTHTQRTLQTKAAVKVKPDESSQKATEASTREKNEEKRTNERTSEKKKMGKEKIVGGLLFQQHKPHTTLHTGKIGRCVYRWCVCVCALMLLRCRRRRPMAMAADDVVDGNHTNGGAWG